MEYSLQREALRCPHSYSDHSFWSICGSSDTWQRFIEKRNKGLSLTRRAQMQRWKKAEESASREANIERLATELLIARLEIDSCVSSKTTGKDKANSWNCFSMDEENKHNEEKNDGNNNSHDNKGVGYDSEDRDDGEDEDDGETIYSLCSGDPRTSRDDFSDMSSRTNVDSWCPIYTAISAQSHDLTYQSFSWADDVEESEAAKVVSKREQLAPDAAKCQTATQTSSTVLPKNHVPTHHTQVKNIYKSQVESLERCQMLGYELQAMYHPGRLQACTWKLSALPCGFDEFSAYSFWRLKGIPVADQAPALIITDERGDHFQVTEIRDSLSEEHIAEIRYFRDSLQRDCSLTRETEDASGNAGQQGQSAAGLWWAAEQKKRDDSYQGWEAEEANELLLLQRQLQQQAARYYEDQDAAEAKMRQHRRLEDRKASEINAFASLRLKMQRDELHPLGDGRWASDQYSVHFTGSALEFFSTRRAEIEAMAFSMGAWEEESLNGWAGTADEA